MSDTATKKKILIVDDERDLSSIYKIGLEAMGYEVRYADNVELGVQIAKEFSPHLILLDMMLPRVSGFDAIPMFRALPETNIASIIAFSALARPEDIARAKDLGADDYLVKASVSSADVIARVRQHIENNPLLP